MKNKKIKRIINVALLFIGLTLSNITAQKSCLSEKNLKILDASWEKAQFDSDTEALDNLLSKDFIWVHNHANTIDNKEAVLNRANRHKSKGTQNARSRRSKDVKVIISGSTGIVSGFTIVDRDPSPTTYHFMRTYIELKGKCLLIANQTMAIPEKVE